MFPQTLFSIVVFLQTIFFHIFPVFFLVVLNITIALLNYFSKNLIDSAIATLYMHDICSTHLLQLLAAIDANHTRTTRTMVPGVKAGTLLI